MEQEPEKNSGRYGECGPRKGSFFFCGWEGVEGEEGKGSGLVGKVIGG
jgi:hypothetical protein